MGRVHHMNIASLGCAKVDVVDVGAGPADDLQVWRCVYNASRDVGLGFHKQGVGVGQGGDQRFRSGIVQDGDAPAFLEPVYDRLLEALCNDYVVLPVFHSVPLKILRAGVQSVRFGPFFSRLTGYYDILLRNRGKPA